MQMHEIKKVFREKMYLTPIYYAYHNTVLKLTLLWYIHWIIIKIRFLNSAVVTKHEVSLLHMG